jgi:hypothetical protein
VDYRGVETSGGKHHNPSSFLQRKTTWYTLVGPHGNEERNPCPLKQVRNVYFAKKHFKCILYITYDEDVSSHGH